VVCGFHLRLRAPWAAFTVNVSLVANQCVYRVNSFLAP